MDKKRPLAVITGAGRGIGCACAELLQPDYTIVVLDMKGAEEAARELGHGAIGITADITSEDSLAEAALRVRELGGAEALVHCAGIFVGFGVPLPTWRRRASRPR